METRLILSYAHFKKNNNRQMGRLKFIMSRAKNLNVLDRFKPVSHIFQFTISRCSKYYDGIRVLAHKHVGLDLTENILEGEILPDGTYQYCFKVKYRGNLLIDNKISFPRPMSLSDEKLCDSFNYPDLQHPDGAFVDKVHADKWYPFKISVKDSLLSFTDPQGTGLSYGYRCKGETIEDLAMMMVLRKIGNILPDGTVQYIDFARASYLLFFSPLDMTYNLKCQAESFTREIERYPNHGIGSSEQYHRLAIELLALRYSLMILQAVIQPSLDRVVQQLRTSKKQSAARMLEA